MKSAIAARDVPAVARLVVAGTSTKVRQAAAEAIEDPDVLRQLIRDVRGGNDKSVYRILTSKRDVLLEQARKQEQLQAEINAAVAALQRHSQRSYDALYSQRLDDFENRWNAVAREADPEQRSRAEQSIGRCRGLCAEALRQMEAQASREQAAARAAAEARRLHEQEAQAIAEAAAEQARALDEQRRILDQEQQTEQQAARQVGDLIRKARAALSDGSTSRAAGIRRAIEEKLAGAPPPPASLASKIQQLDQQLDALKDWKSFSVAPKRAELIEEMESLIGPTLDPLALADRIKRLKDQWRTLGRGAGDTLDPALEADRQRFQEAAQKAYQPCGEYFAAQALVREENLRRRDDLLASLIEFEAGTHWEQADWRTVIKTLRETKQEWRRCSPVDLQAARRQQERYMALTASLQARLDAEYARNVQQKQSLIERARALLASEDGRKAIDAAKDLQSKWRAVSGPVPREMDQRLWSEFRQHCDAVFQKREQEFAAYAAGLENNKAQAMALCAQIESLANLEGTELLTRAGERVALRNAFEALGEFPRADTHELRNRLDRAMDRCEKSLARQQARDAERSWNDLFEAARHVHAYRLAVASGAATDQLATLKEAVESYIASVQQWPKGGLEALMSGLDQALAGGRSSDLAANEAALRMLCIRAEVLADLQTPPEDQALRREYQLQRLVQNMGQGLRPDEAQWEALAIEWVSVGPVEDAAYAPLVQRFRRCRARNNSNTR